MCFELHSQTLDDNSITVASAERKTHKVGIISVCMLVSVVRVITYRSPTTTDMEDTFWGKRGSFVSWDPPRSATTWRRMTKLDDCAVFLQMKPVKNELLAKRHPSQTLFWEFKWKDNVDAEVHMLNEVVLKNSENKEINCSFCLHRFMGLMKRI